MSEILAPAIRLADEGFPVAPLTAYFWSRGADGQLKSSLNGNELTIDGRGPRASEIFRNPGLAKTLSVIARENKRGFYQGQIAEAVVSVIKEAGGCMSADDLESHGPPGRVRYPSTIADCVCMNVRQMDRASQP